MARNTNIEPEIERRHFLHGVGVLAGAAATAGLIEQRALAQGMEQTSGKLMPDQSKIIDFHSTMQNANLSDDEQNAIATGNCRRLLGLG